MRLSYSGKRWFKRSPTYTIDLYSQMLSGQFADQFPKIHPCYITLARFLKIGFKVGSTTSFFLERFIADSYFTIEEVELRFDLQLQAVSFLPATTPIAPSNLLTRYNKACKHWDHHDDSKQRNHSGHWTLAKPFPGRVAYCNSAITT